MDDLSPFKFDTLPSIKSGIKPSIKPSDIDAARGKIPSHLRNLFDVVVTDYHSRQTPKPQNGVTFKGQPTQKKVNKNSLNYRRAALGLLPGYPVFAGLPLFPKQFAVNVNDDEDEDEDDIASVQRQMLSIDAEIQKHGGNLQQLENEYDEKKYVDHPIFPITDADITNAKPEHVAQLKQKQKIQQTAAAIERLRETQGLKVIKFLPSDELKSTIGKIEAETKQIEAEIKHYEDSADKKTGIQPEYKVHINGLKSKIQTNNKVLKVVNQQLDKLKNEKVRKKHDERAAKLMGYKKTGPQAPQQAPQAPQAPQADQPEELPVHKPLEEISYDNEEDKEAAAEADDPEVDDPELKKQEIVPAGAVDEHDVKRDYDHLQKNASDLFASTFKEEAGEQTFFKLLQLKSKAGYGNDEYKVKSGAVGSKYTLVKIITDGKGEVVVSEPIGKSSKAKDDPVFTAAKQHKILGAVTGAIINTPIPVGDLGDGATGYIMWAVKSKKAEPAAASSDDEAEIADRPEPAPGKAESIAEAVKKRGGRSRSRKAKAAGK